MEHAGADDEATKTKWNATMEPMDETIDWMGEVHWNVGEGYDSYCWYS